MMGKNKVFIAIGIIVALLAAAAGGYMYYKRTPTYTFNLIKEAVEKHDYDTFSRHVDTENIISCAYDDLMAAALDDDDTDESIKGFADGFIKMLKPGIVGALDDSVKQFVKTGKRVIVKMHSRKRRIIWTASRRLTISKRKRTLIT